jgi:hypothetical protein
MKKACMILALLAIASAANATVVTYGWEDGGSYLGTYASVDLVNTGNSTDMARSGSASLKYVDYPDSTTPQLYLAYIENLNVGDVVTAGFWVYDNNAEGLYPKGRIWGHYALNGDVMSHSGSAGGNNTYSAGPGWSYLEQSWTIPAGKEALVVEARIYSDTALNGNVIYIDDLTVTAPSTAKITVPVPEPGMMSLIGLGGVALLRRRK